VYELLLAAGWIPAALHHQALPATTPAQDSLTAVAGATDDGKSAALVR